MRERKLRDLEKRKKELENEEMKDVTF